MNKNHRNIPESEGVKDLGRLKSLTPAILGVANPHGVKLSLNMTSEDKKEMLSQLEEWRKIRREKLAASILAKQKQIEKPKTSRIQMPEKSRTVAGGGVGNSKVLRQESVFERLYRNNGKTNNPDTNIYSNKALFYSKKSAPPPLENSNKTKISLPGKEKSNMFHTGFHKEVPLDAAVVPAVETRKHIYGNDLPKIFKGKTNEAKKTAKNDSYPMKDQIRIYETKPAFRCLTSEVFTKMSETERQKNPLRRSISMMFRRKRHCDSTVRRSVSAKNLNEIGLNKHVIDYTTSKTLAKTPENIVKGMKNEASVKSVSFVTPKSNASLTSTHLRTKLENWLKGNGHSLEGYRHLRCFGITNERKSLETPAVPSGNACKNSFYAASPNTFIEDSDKENVTPPIVTRQVNVSDVENWLKELHRLIIELKYPSERCEEWLTAIRKKCASCTHLPIYWECLAAVHESKGDLKSAIEDYERAIIKGGEVDVVGDSLAQLFDKMVIEQEKHSKRKLEKGLDPKNIFKSTIIKFALQQKALKKLSTEMKPGVRQHLYVATPVRRSTRIQTPFKSSEEVTSLQTLTPELLKNVTFQPNESLLHRD